ncbi:hypothetical protein CRENBAI_005538 [Crenichthys baileyi]|uniref:Centromere protein Q n=1 Tax=Crenichthys baileyi TaxID=28760 RepID=A0AAV9QY11_9TELE
MPKNSQANKIEQDTKASEAAASSACLSRPDVTETAANVQQVILKEFQLIKQELLEKINKKTTETQTELRSSIKKPNKRLDKVESHTSELDNGVTTNSDSITPVESNMFSMEKELTLLKEKLRTLDRAHRNLRTKPTKDDQPLRAFVVKCHYFTLKELILRKAAEAGVMITADGDHIHVLPDFTRAVSTLLPR